MLHGSRVALMGVLGVLVGGCSGSSADSPGDGGNSGAGGSTAQGAGGTGGIAPGGGATSAGGAAGSGGGSLAGTGGSILGSGGIGVGGNATGGVAAGGVGTGGLATGGVTGVVATGGASTGGRATGGASTSGLGTGGRATGGVTGVLATGGAVTGGSGNGTGGGSGAPIVCPALGSKPLPAFPGAEGFGAAAKGGRGGDVYHVTNLSSSGAGSFAYGILNAPATGRTIVFDVSGYADISGTVRVTKPFLTIAGQTAPGDGFALKNGTFWLSGANAIIRFMRFRDGYSADSVDMDSSAVNFIWDHCDMMFSHDENMSSFGTPPENMTYQYSINAWGLETHSCGGLWDQGHATAHHTLWAHNHTRNPKARAVLLDWINNVTFDWDIGFIMGDSQTPIRWQANVRGSYFVSGTSKSDALESASLDSNGTPNFYLFMEDCALDGNINGVLDVTKTDYAMASGSYGKVTTPFPQTANSQPVSASNPLVGVAVTQDDHLTAYKKVISSAGPLRLDVKSPKPLRDEIDALLVNDLVTQNHRHLTYLQIDANGLGNSGYGTLSSTPAPADTDRDGMPDYWEKAVGLNSTVDDHNGLVPCIFAYVPGNIGYTWLEDYLQWLAIPHGVVAQRTATGGAAGDTFIDVDMSRFTSGLKSSAVFTVSAAVNGTVSVLADGHTARFVPNVSFVGRAGFKFAGTDSDKSTIGFDVGILVAETVP